MWEDQAVSHTQLARTEFLIVGRDWEKIGSHWTAEAAVGLHSCVSARVWGGVMRSVRLVLALSSPRIMILLLILSLGHLECDSGAWWKWRPYQSSSANGALSEGSSMQSKAFE